MHSVTSVSTTKQSAKLNLVTFKARCICDQRTSISFENVKYRLPINQNDQDHFSTPTEVIQPSLSPLIISTPCDGIPALGSTSHSATRVVQFHQSASASADEEAQSREQGQDDEEFDVG
jgi:hypothetical protein